MAAKGSKVNNHIVDLITPVGIKFEQTNLWLGDNVASIAVITNYPPKVEAGWLAAISNMEGVICSIHMEPASAAKLVENISKSIGELRQRIINGGAALYISRAEDQLEDAETLLKRIDRMQESVFHVTIVLMIIARNKEELERKKKAVFAKIAGRSMKARVAAFLQEDSLKAVSPYGTNIVSIENIAKRNMPVSTIAASFPFDASGINDGKGLLFGKDNKGGVILFDLWQRGGDRTNSNLSVLGAPGVGKSTAVKHIICSEYAQGTKIIILDPEREYRDLCNNLGGKWINCGGGKGGKINPLQVKHVPKDDENEEEKLFEDTGHGVGDLALHFQTLRTFFNLYMKSLDDIDYAYLEETLEELYKDFGVTWNTDVSKLGNNEFPIIEDLFNAISKKSEDDNLNEMQKKSYTKLKSLLRRISIGADASLWNGHTTIEADSDFIVLDTHDLQESDNTNQRTQYFNILTWAWQQLSQDRTEKVLLIVDEAYLTVDPEVPQALKFLRNISKRIRKYEGGLMVISHSVVDFLDPAVRRYGQALLDNPCFKFFMGTDGKDLMELAELMNLTEAEQEMLSKKQRAHGLLIAGSKRVHGIVELADHELEYFGKAGGR